MHLDLSSFTSSSVHYEQSSAESWALVYRRHSLPGPWVLEPLFLGHLAIRPFLPAALGFRLLEVPIHRIEKLLGLFVCPVGVDDEREQGQTAEEQCEVRQVQAADESVPVRKAHPPEVVGEDHAAVKHVDHEPLVDLPEQGARPASLWTGQAQCQYRM